MGLTQYELQLVKNGVTVYDEPPMFIEGKDLGEALTEVLEADGEQIKPTHVNVNGVTHNINDLSGMTINEDIEIELIAKSKGGN